MDTIEVPNFKLAKVGKEREKKRGGGGWLGARGAGSGFSGAVGGAGAGAGGLMGTGMSLAKLLMILLVSGVVSAGAWKMGGMFVGDASDGKPAAAKVFADKDAGKYADTSGVIKNEKSIPNSLGYINNDGLTDEQRAAKKAADDAAAAKAAADAQAKADADAKAKALADAAAASATPEAVAPAAAGPEAVARKGLTAGKFGSLGSSTGGGGGLSGGAGLSGGINGKFAGMGGLGGKGQNGAISAFRSPSKAASSGATPASHGHSNAKGFARQQLDQAFGQSRSALATGKSESASAGAGAPFDNNGAQGTAISGPGLGSGTQTGAADGSGATNPGTGGGGPTDGGGGTTPCTDPNTHADSTGACVTTNAPPGKDAAPYQGMLDTVLILMGIVLAINIVALVFGGKAWFTAIAAYLAGIMCALGAVICGLGIAIAAMKHGDFMIGAIVGVVGAFICIQGAMAVTGANSMSGTPMTMANQAAPTLLATAAGALAAGSKAVSLRNAAMQ